MKNLACVAVLFGAALLVSASTAAEKPATPPTPAPVLFDKVKALVGEWSGKDPAGKPIDVSYRLASNGTAVLETITMANHDSMITVYHPDGDDVMLTHYCAGGNQPRLRAKAGANEIAFDFVDATNLPSPTSPHMHAMKLVVEDKDHIREEWTVVPGDKEKPHVLQFTRKP